MAGKSRPPRELEVVTEAGAIDVLHFGKVISALASDGEASVETAEGSASGEAEDAVLAHFGFSSCSGGSSHPIRQLNHTMNQLPTVR